MNSLGGPTIRQVLGVGNTYVELCVLLYVYEGAGFDSLMCPVVYICNLEEGWGRVIGPIGHSSVSFYFPSRVCLWAGPCFPGSPGSPAQAE